MRRKSFCKLLLYCLTALILLHPGLSGIAKTEAASFGETLIYGAVAFSYINGQLNNINDHKQSDMLSQCEKKTGVYDNEQTNYYLRTMTKRLEGNGIIRNHYSVYANPDKQVNAFCTLGRVISINKGALDALDEDEMATVLGHEMGHGEEKDPVEGMKKQLGLALVVDLYVSKNPNTTSEVLASVGANMINSEVFTMNQEWRADNHGFEYATAAGYNPGGGAAAMAKLRSMYGDQFNHGIVRLVNPNDHPRLTDRIKNFGKLLSDYSGGHVGVRNDKTVQLNGQDIVSPSKTSYYLPEERAYLIAGNLAKAYHNGTVGEAYASEDGAVYIGEQRIMTAYLSDSSAQEIADRINAITAK
ncbi:MAG: M48 family metallopeptidase [Negativicutes bacterium]|nr:M48 family metallopeptidase [Negativicutes bacterium]